MTAEQVVTRYQAQYGHIRNVTVARVVALWRAFGGVDDDALAAFLTAVLPTVAAGQTAVGALVSAYVATMLRAAGETATVAPLGAISVDALRGTAAAEVYARPVVALRTALADGKLYDYGMKLAGQRVEQLASSDVAMAQREAIGRAVEGDERFFGYRRVLTGRSCALCAVASAQRYHRRPMPIHANCDCGVAPIIGTVDPGQTINRQIVDNLKAAAQKTGTAAYWKNRHVTVNADGTVNLPEIAVHEHGELGAVLGDAAHSFTGPGGIAA